MTLAGFTGTRQGMTEAQKATVERLLEKDLRLTRVHHGSAIGADAEFHEIAGKVGIEVTLHLSDRPDQTADCKGAVKVHAPLTPLARNRCIVAMTEYMIAAPAESLEQRRGGTWSTIRYARMVKRPVIIVYPDGNTSEHGGVNYGNA